jgi:hypothetical protein
MDLSAFIGKRDVRREKTTQAQLGTDFAVLRAQESTRAITQRIKLKYGELIAADELRPWPGAFAIVSEDMVATWLHLLATNGLRRFSDLLLVDWFTKAEPASAETRDSINILIAIETFCDRFSMYLYENYLKIRLYDELLLNRRGYPVTVDAMLVLEAARGEGRLATRPEMTGVSEAERARLEQDLKNAQHDHVYISAFDDPELTAAERKFFGDFLELLKHIDSEHKILRFTMQHANTSRFMLATAGGLVDEAERNQAASSPLT